MKVLIKTLLILAFAVSGSYTTYSCSTGGPQKACTKQSKPAATVQVTEEELGYWQLSSKFNY